MGRACVSSGWKRVVSTPLGMTERTHGIHRRVAGDTTTVLSATRLASTSENPRATIRAFSLAPRIVSASSKHEPWMVRTCTGTRRRHIQ